MADIQTRNRDSDTGAPVEAPMRRPAFLVSAVLVVLLLGIGGTVVWTNLANDGGTPSPSTSSIVGRSSTTPSSSAFSPSVCGLPGLETEGTVARAPSAKWSLIGTTAAPTSTGTDGPGVINGNGLRYCFAHTPSGAVFAAANFVALGSTPSIFNQVVEHSVAKGTGQDALLTAGPAQSGDVRIQIMGFRMLTYDAGHTASVDIALRTSRGALASQVYDLVWEDGDWRMRVTDQGELLSPAAQISDLQGYVSWAGA